MAVVADILFSGGLFRLKNLSLLGEKFILLASSITAIATIRVNKVDQKKEILSLAYSYWFHSIIVTLVARSSRQGR